VGIGAEQGERCDRVGCCAFRCNWNGRRLARDILHHDLSRSGIRHVLYAYHCADSPESADRNCSVPCRVPQTVAHPRCDAHGSRYSEDAHYRQPGNANYEVLGPCSSTLIPVGSGKNSRQKTSWGGRTEAPLTSSGIALCSSRTLESLWRHYPSWSVVRSWVAQESQRQQSECPLMLFLEENSTLLQLLDSDGYDRRREAFW
jgi:hypothetical protein